jgi:hypothetical protein
MRTAGGDGGEEGSPQGRRLGAKWLW